VGPPGTAAVDEPEARAGCAQCGNRLRGAACLVRLVHVASLTGQALSTRCTSSRARSSRPCASSCRHWSAVADTAAHALAHQLRTGAAAVQPPTDARFTESPAARRPGALAVGAIRQQVGQRRRGHAVHVGGQVAAERRRRAQSRQRLRRLLLALIRHPQRAAPAGLAQHAVRAGAARPRRQISEHAEDGLAGSPRPVLGGAPRQRWQLPDRARIRTVGEAGVGLPPVREQLDELAGRVSATPRRGVLGNGDPAAVGVQESDGGQEDQEHLGGGRGAVRPHRGVADRDREDRWPPGVRAPAVPAQGERHLPGHVVLVVGADHEAVFTAIARTRSGSRSTASTRARCAVGWTDAGTPSADAIAARSLETMRASS
jgi:hypothetical protein